MRVITVVFSICNILVGCVSRQPPNISSLQNIPADLAVFDGTRRIHCQGQSGTIDISIEQMPHPHTGIVMLFMHGRMPNGELLPHVVSGPHIVAVPTQKPKPGAQPAAPAYKYIFSRTLDHQNSPLRMEISNQDHPTGSGKLAEFVYSSSLHAWTVVCSV